MQIWVIAWVNGNGTPDMDVFTDLDRATECLRFMAKSGRAAIVRPLSIQQKEPEAEPEAEQPAEDENGAKVVPIGGEGETK